MGKEIHLQFKHSVHRKWNSSISFHFYAQQHTVKQSTLLFCSISQYFSLSLLFSPLPLSPSLFFLVFILEHMRWPNPSPFVSHQSLHCFTSIGKNWSSYLPNCISRASKPDFTDKLECAPTDVNAGHSFFCFIQQEMIITQFCYNIDCYQRDQCLYHHFQYSVVM